MKAQRSRSNRALIRTAMRPVALGLAYLLVLQVLLVGLTQGSQAAPSADPGFFGVICASGAAPGQNGPDHAPGAPGHADCCVLGCAMFGPSVAPPPMGIAIAPVRRTQVSVVAPHGIDSPLLPDRPSPRSTRGPPRTI